MAIVFIRTLIVYAALLLTMRLLGKRQLGEMELSEFVVAALIADLAAHPLQDIGIPMMNGLIPILTLFCCEVLIAGISLKHIRLRTLLFGKPSILISHGKIDQRELWKNRFTLDELMQEMRSQGALDISNVEYAILETDGRLNVMLYPSEMPATASQLQLPVPDKGYPVILISDGRIIEDNLQRCGKSRAWLDEQLRERKAKSAGEVFLMMLNGAGQIYFARKEGPRET